MSSTTPSAITATPSRRPSFSRLMIAPTSVSARVFSRIGRRMNSSWISVSVAPAALPMPSARWPALRPMAITKYQREVVLASTSRFLRISTPRWRAVWNPKVSTCGGRSRSLSMDLGTCTTWMRPWACWCRRSAEKAVSSPPIVIRSVTPSRSSEITVFSRYSGLVVGLARETPMYEPPRKWIRLTFSMVSGRTLSTLPCISHSNPSSTPSTSTPSSAARIVAAPMTALIPGAGPPPTSMASFFT